MSDIYSQLQAAAHSGAFGVNELALPSAEQCRAGNYQKGRVVLHGMPIAIEVPQGQRRMGKSDGKPWSTILMAHYGYLVGTNGADGDALDVFIGPVPESARVWVVNQVDKDGNFDEHKILMGFIDEQSACAAYMNSYERGWTGLGSLIPCSMDQLKWWITYGNTAIALTEQALPHDGNTTMNEIVWDNAAAPVGCDLADLIYRLRRADSDDLMLDAVTVADIMESAEGEAALDALVVPYNKAERKAEQLRRIMESVGGDVAPASVQVTPPFKQRGTTNVVFLYELSDGQTVSIWMHNPDSTPNRILPQDELVSWRWMLNKKDITLLVAPERGIDLNPREVARRIMKLAQKNSQRFAKANSTRAERMQNIEGLKGGIAAKETELAELYRVLSELTTKVEEKRNRKPATLQTNDQEDGRPTETETATKDAHPATVERQGNDDSKAITLSGKELGDFSDTPEGLKSLRDAAIAFLRDIRDNKQGLDCPILGHQVFVRSRGIREFRAFSGNPLKLKLVAGIKGLVHHAYEKSWSANYKLEDKPTIEGYFTLKARAVVAEKEHDVKILVEKDKDGSFYYDFLLDKKAKAALDSAALAPNHDLIYSDLDDGQKNSTVFDAVGQTDDARYVVNLFIDDEEPEEVSDEEPEQTHSQWEGEVIDLIAEKLGIQHSDAQGMVEAQDFYLTQSWGKGMSAQETADKIMEESRAPEDEQIQYISEYLQSVIDGNVDFMDEGLGSRLEKIHDDYTNNEEVMALFEKAAQAYSDYMVELARSALAA